MTDRSGQLMLKSPFYRIYPKGKIRVCRIDKVGYNTSDFCFADSDSDFFLFLNESMSASDSAVISGIS